MTFLIWLLNILLIGWIAWHVRKGSEILKPFFWPAFFLKMAAGIGVGVVYVFYYRVGDTLSYFSDAGKVAALFDEDPGAYLNFLWNHNSEPALLPQLIFRVPRALLFVKIVSAFYLLTFGSYWIIALYFSLFSFLGAWYFVRKILKFFPVNTGGAMVAFLLLPSVVFWSSGVIKESLAMAALFFLSGIFLTIWFGEKIKWFDWLIIIVSVWVLWSLKYYFAAVFFAVVINSVVYKLIISRFSKPRLFIVEILVWGFIFLLPVLIVTQSHPNFAITKLLVVVADNYQAFVSISAPEDVIHFDDLRPVAGSIVKNSPLALVSGLFRPFVWEVSTFLQLVVAVENLFLLMTCTAALLWMRKMPSSGHRMLIFSCLMYIVLLCVFITLSTPNFGTLSRYRVAYIPYFLFLLLCSPRLAGILERTYNHLVPKES